MVFALMGIALNCGLILQATREMHAASWVYHDLLRDPRAYGRAISPQVIATLQHRPGLWISYALLVVASAAGLLLAIGLMVSLTLLRRGPIRAGERLRLYAKYKPMGAAATALLFLWSGAEDHSMWVAATRHWPIGSSSAPWFSSAILFLCAMMPVWWLRSSWRSTTGATLN